MDKDLMIASMVLDALRAGYKITFEGPTVGAVSKGIHLHVTDELVEEQGGAGSSNYLNDFLDEHLRGVESVKPEQAAIDEIFRKASRDIANMPPNLSFHERGRGIDAIMANARADADVIRKGEKQ